MLPMQETAGRNCCNIMYKIIFQQVKPNSSLKIKIDYCHHHHRHLVKIMRLTKFVHTPLNLSITI